MLSFLAPSRTCPGDKVCKRVNLSPRCRIGPAQARSTTRREPSNQGSLINWFERRCLDRLQRAITLPAADRKVRNRAERPGLVRSSRPRRNTRWQRHDGRLLDVGQTLFQQLGHFLGQPETVVGPLGHEFGDDLAEPFGNLGVDLTDRAGLFVGDPPQHAVARLGPERRAAGRSRRTPATPPDPPGRGRGSASWVVFPASNSSKGTFSIVLFSDSAQI